MNGASSLLREGGYRLGGFYQIKMLAKRYFDLRGGTAATYSRNEISRHVASQFRRKKLGRPDIMVTAGGVIPAQDYDFLYKAGVAAIFGPGTPVAYSAKVVMQLLMQE